MITIELIDEREDDPELGKAIYHYEGGLKDFVSYLDESREGITPEPIHISGEVEGVPVDLAIQYNTSYSEMFTLM